MIGDADRQCRRSSNQDGAEVERCWRQGEGDGVAVPSRLTKSREVLESERISRAPMTGVVV